jgi:hypothetical protein
MSLCRRESAVFVNGSQVDFLVARCCLRLDLFTVVYMDYVRTFSFQRAQSGRLAGKY